MWIETATLRALRRAIAGKHRKRLRAGHRLPGAQRAEVAVAAECCLQELVILPPRYLDRAENPEVIGHELRVQQLEPAGLEPGHEMHERNLGRVACAVEHALAEERAAKWHAVKTPDEGVALVDFQTVAMAAIVQLAIEDADARIDPGARAVGLRLRAALEHGVEVPVHGDGEAVGAHRADEPRRHVKTIERNDATHLRLDPVER